MMIVEEMLHLKVGMNVKESGDIFSLSQVVKAEKGEGWHIDWAKWLNAQHAYDIESAIPDVIALPIYKIEGD